MQMKMVTNLVSVALLLSGARAMASDATTQTSLLKNPKVKVAAGAAGVALVGYYTYQHAFAKNEVDDKRKAAEMRRKSDVDVRFAEKILKAGRNNNVTAAELRALEGIRKSAETFASLKKDRISSQLKNRQVKLDKAMSNVHDLFGGDELTPCEITKAIKDNADKANAADKNELDELNKVLSEANNNAKEAQEVELDAAQSAPSSEGAKEPESKKSN